MTARRWVDGRCTCCGASVAGWSDAGRAAGLRENVALVYRDEHDRCALCGQPVDQYGECRHEPLSATAQILVDYGLIASDAAAEIDHNNTSRGEE